MYEYDGLNRLKRVIDPLGNTTEYTYDDRDNLFSLRDANNNITYFEYDRNNRLVKEIRPMGEETTYQYDGNGNLVEKIDPKGQKTEYTYDAAGRLVEIRYFEASDHSNPVKTVAFTYDSVGNLTGYDDGVTSATYSYDNLYRKTSETVNYGNFSLTYSYTYYTNGLKKTFTNANGITYTYSYDTNNQLTGVQIPNIGFVTIGEYTWSRPASITLPGGSTKEYMYDSLMRVKNINAGDPGGNTLLDYAYTYDRMDNILSKDTEHGDYQYDYDNLYRLTSADNPVQDDEEFTYDPVGNRLTSSDTTGLWAYNDNNELNAHNDTSYEYDDNGNMIQKISGSSVTSYVHNIEDRLSEVWNGEPVTGSLIAEYYYDPFGRRLRKDVGGTKTYFMYADEGLIVEYDSTGTEIKTYGWKPGSTWSTDPLFMKIGSDYYFYHNDHLGTPQKMTGVNGGVVWSATYSAFGQVEIDPESSVVNNLRFPGQYEDQETGLYYNYHRYYDSESGRYFTQDPIGYWGGLNLLSYGLGNPVNNLDHFGLKSRGGCFSACVLDAGINYAIGFIPGLKFVKDILLGVDINLFQVATGYNSVLDQDATGTLAGFSSLGYGLAYSSFEAAGGKTALKSAAEESLRKGFKNRLLHSQAKVTRKINHLTKLRKLSRLMGKVNGIFNTLDFAMDLYDCHKNCKKYEVCEQ